MKHIRSLILALALSAGLAPAFAQAPPAVPALPDTERRTSYTISGSLCTCAVGFQLYGDSTDYANWLEVWVNGAIVTQSGNWTITSPTGSLASIPRPITDAVLTFTTAQTGTVQIVGARRPRRTSQFSESRGVAARDLNQVITDLVAQNRENWDKTNDVTGRVPRAPPGETLAMLPVLASRANQGACFDNNGNLTSCVSVPSSAFVAGNGVTFTGSGPTTISVSTYSPGTGVQFTGSNPTVISVNQTTSAPVVPSRAAAATQDLSAYTVIRTLGYATGGDGGDATFQKKAAGTPFTDTYINNSSSPPTLVGGSGYTNAVYLGVPLGGSATGFGCSGKVTVSGGAVTAVSLAVPCAGYKVGDVLTAANSFLGGAGSGFTWTVTAISTQQASFIDAAGNRWQFSPDGIPNALQFGCKGDWNGTDASATDNAACLWSAASWASFPLSTSQAQVNGNRIYVPRGAYMVCGAWNGTIYTIPVPQGVVFSGPGVGGATLLECATNNSGTYFIELCDSNSAVGQYGCKVENMTIKSDQITGSTGGAATIYSTSGQQFPLADTVEIQPGLKGCIKYDVGLGGAANDIWLSIDCEQSQGAANPGYSFNASTTQHVLWRSTYGCTGTGCATAIQNLNGRLMVDGLDIENVATGLLHSVTTANNNGVYKNVQQNSNHCTQAIFLNGSTGGNLIMENVSTGCPLGILNGQSGGTNYASGVIRGALMCVSGACAAAVP